MSLAAGLLMPAANVLQPHMRLERRLASWLLQTKHTRVHLGISGRFIAARRPAGRCRSRCMASSSDESSIASDRTAPADRAQGWGDRLATSAVAVCLAVAIVATGCVSPIAAVAAQPLSIAVMAPAVKPAPDDGADGPFDGLQRQLREVDRSITKQLRNTRQLFNDSWQFLLPSPSKSEEELAAAAEDGAELVWEVWDVVDREFLDARGTGFDREAWAAMRDVALSRPLSSPAAAHRAVKDMLAQGLRDPFSRFISPKEFESMLDYDVTGVGLNLGTAEEFKRKVGPDFPPGRENAEDGIWILGIIQGSAADVAGLQQGDELLELDSSSLSALSPYQVSAALAGDASEGAPPPPPEIRLAVRDSQGDVREFSMPRTVREDRPTVAASVQKLPNGGRVGVIRISSFTGRTQVEVAQALTKFSKEGVAAVDLDLRGNLGGLVNQGVEIARLFLSEGAVIVVKEEGRDVAPAVTMADGPPMTAVPLTVLVDGDTASAAEILAGALQDNCRGLLVGSRTYGKGLIQSVYELHDASGLALTVGRYRTPGGVDIDQTGIVPNFRGRPSPEVAAARLRACVPPSLSGF